MKPSNETAIRSRDTIRLLVMLVDDRQPGYARHAEAVARLSYITGLELGLEPAAHEDLRLAALLHDVGVLRLAFTVVRGGTFPPRSDAHTKPIPRPERAWLRCSACPRGCSAR